MPRYSAFLLVALLTGCSHSLSTPGKLGRQPINVSGQVIGSVPVRQVPQTRPEPQRVPINQPAPVAPAPTMDTSAPSPLPYPAAVPVSAARRVFKVHFPAGGTRFDPDPANARDLANAVRAASRIEVYGRTDGERPSAADEAVALKRAAGARDYLVQLGADPRRIFLQYLSATDYLGDNTTVFGRSQNRRVEIHVL